MTLKLESTTTWTHKRLKLGMVLSFDPHKMCAKVDKITTKNKMYFVYKLDHLFQITRVSDENSSVTKTFHFSKLISTQDFFFHPTCNIQSHILKFQPFLTLFAIFHAFNDLFSAK